MVRHFDRLTRLLMVAGDRARAVVWLLDRLTRPLPVPPEGLRRGPLRADAFRSAERSTRLTSVLGIALGGAFAICFGTGLISHLIQHPAGWFWWPSRPVGLYRFTQGLHVATGLACVPLLGAKLWSVYPRLFGWPPVRSLAHAAERVSVAVLVGAALFQVVGGVLNIAHWYGPMPFFFTDAHYRVAWLAVGALLVHIGVQLPVVRAALRQPETPEVRRPEILATRQPETSEVRQPENPAPGQAEAPEVRRPETPERRRLLVAVGAAIGVITLATVGQTVRPLAGVSPLAPRRPGRGPQGLPVNRTAGAAGVRDAVLDPGYRLTVTGFGRTLRLSLAELAAMPQHTTVLPIACVEGWSSTGTWTGVPLWDLAALLGVDPDDCEAEVESLQAGGRYRSSTVPGTHLKDFRTLLALRLGGEPLALDHGYPARLIAPNRPGVLQTKWVGRITVRGAS